MKMVGNSCCSMQSRQVGRGVPRMVARWLITRAKCATRLTRSARSTKRPTRSTIRRSARGLTRSTRRPMYRDKVEGKTRAGGHREGQGTREERVKTSKAKFFQS